MPRPDGPRVRSRIQTYLSSEELTGINRLRGRYLTETGQDIRVTQVVRAALGHLAKADWKQVRALLDEHRQRRD